LAKDCLTAKGEKMRWKFLVAYIFLSLALIFAGELHSQEFRALKVSQISSIDSQKSDFLFSNLKAKNISDSPNNEYQLHRKKSLFGIKTGLEGIGLDLATKWVGLEANTFLFLNSLKIRFYLKNDNDSPFVGIGYGSLTELDIGGGDSYSYFLAYFGLEVAGTHLFGQSSFQIPFGRVRESVKVIPSLLIGYRF
jgi:hypothetical protein